MSKLNKIITEMTDPFWNQFNDYELIWGKPANELTFGDFRDAKAEIEQTNKWIADLNFKNAALCAERDEAVRFLDYLEWGGKSTGDYICPECGNNNHHTDDCKLDAFLTRIRDGSA